MKNTILIIAIFTSFFSCSKSDPVNTIPDTFTMISIQVDDKPPTGTIYDVSLDPVVKILFSSKIDHASVNDNILLKDKQNNIVPADYSFTNDDSTIIIQPLSSLNYLSNYSINILTNLTSQNQAKINTTNTFRFITSIDSSDKFPAITDSALLTLVQKQTFKYFWDFGHPVSGMARERNTSGDLVTSGGTGFGMMAIPVAIKRNFITRAEGLARTQQIVDFLQNNCTTYHGAFAHWINGTTGATIPFSPQDDGADIVETSYLVEGLLTARQYFNSTIDVDEISLRGKINQVWSAIDWNWFRKNNENILYWHWSPTQNFSLNAQVSGWNEALITYVLAASSPSNSIPRIVYDNGWANNGGIINNNAYYGYTLPLGPSQGGPLFFEHYSFMGIDPTALSDVYANYQTQTTNHTKINYEYCKANPRRWNGYSELCWGLTASDVPTGYNANEPNNDPGVIAPTAALSSMPYTPTESLNALRFFYYKLGDKIWGPYGFYDAFKLSDPWFATSTLAIDQGPIIVMIENYRSGLPWSLFTSCPEIQNGMRNLGFTAPYL